MELIATEWEVYFSYPAVIFKWKARSVKSVEGHKALWWNVWTCLCCQKPKFKFAWERYI